MKTEACNEPIGVLCKFVIRHSISKAVIADFHTVFICPTKVEAEEFAQSRLMVGMVWNFFLIRAEVFVWGSFPGFSGAEERIMRDVFSYKDFGKMLRAIDRLHLNSVSEMDTLLQAIVEVKLA